MWEEPYLNSLDILEDDGILWEPLVGFWGSEEGGEVEGDWPLSQVEEEQLLPRLAQEEQLRDKQLVGQHESQP